MNNFITFENSPIKYDYIFNKNHFLILLISLVIIIFFSMYISRQKMKVQKIIVLVFAFLVLIMEGLRIFWNYKYLDFHGENLSFVNVVNLDMFTICLWISIPLIIISAILRNKKRKQILGLDFVFCITTLFAIISLIYPEKINSNFEFYHCYNLMYTLLRSFTIMLGLTFAFAKWISVGEFLDLWKALACLAIIGGICIGLNFILGTEFNLFYVEFCPIFESIGIHLPFPLHYIMLGVFIFIFQIILYLPFRLHKIHKLKHGKF